MVEPQIVVLAVAGSSPVDHPSERWSDGVVECCFPTNYSITPLLRYSITPAVLLGT